MGMIQEFKDFISKGNVIDLAVAVVLGKAFGEIVSALVDQIIMPVVGMALGGVNFKDLSVVVNSVPIKYGMFIQAIVDFVLIAFVIFIGIKMYNKTKKPAPAAPPAGPTQEDLLAEIRDLLKK